MSIDIKLLRKFELWTLRQMALSHLSAGKDDCMSSKYRIFKFTQIFEIFNHSPISMKEQSINKCCCQKRGVKLSIVFVTVRFRIVLSIFGEKGESNFAFSAKGGVKLIVVGKNKELNCALSAVYKYSEKKRNYGFRQICGVKRSVLQKNAE